MLSLRVVTVGSSVGVILPEEAPAFLEARKGDTVYPTEAADGSYRLTPCDPGSRRQMARADIIMREDRDVLRALTG